MIKINNLSKTYIMKYGNLPVLENVNLNVPDGVFAAIVGKSGSGKSTLMNIIGCLDYPTSGEYLLDGVNVAHLSSSQLANVRNRKIGFIFQNFNLIPNLTAIENVELPLIYRHIPKSERRRLAEDALATVELQHRKFHKPCELSGGQQQRVAIARAIAAKPPLILADEPCGNLDSNSGSVIMDILHSFSKLGITVLLITHDINAAKSADLIFRACDGSFLRQPEIF